MHKVVATIFILSGLLLPPMVSSSQTVVINEVMSSNATTISDENGEYGDWIELYNTSPSPVNLQSFGLSDDFSQPFKWVFPSVSIGPGEFILVWATGKNRTNPSMPLHTNFSLKAEGEVLILTNPLGIRLDGIAPVPIPTDISFGRKPDGAEAWFYFDEATPGGTNSTPGYLSQLPRPTFSHQGGFYSQDITLSINHNDPNVTFIYTTDGSIPSIDNTDGTSYSYKNSYPFYVDSPFGEFLNQSFTSQVYSGGILVTNRSGEPNKLANISSTAHDPYYIPKEPIAKGTVVRVRAYRDDFLPSEVVTNTYFISPEGKERFKLPVISLSIQEDYLFDYNYGIYTAGIMADNWRQYNPGENFKWPFTGNYILRTSAWEYPAHFEMFEGGSKMKVVDQEIGFRIHGATSRCFPMKSLRLFARNSYGESEFDYPFFSDRPHTNYKRLILRNSGHDFPTSIWSASRTARTMLRDATIQEMVKHLNVTTQAYTPTVVLINGEYWGIHNIRELYDKHFFQRVFDVPHDSLDLLYSFARVSEGSNRHYNETISYIKTNGVEDDTHYQHILTRIDVENYIDYQISNIFARNTDWPGNNVDFWRYSREAYKPDAQYGHDGRWRWLIYDTDFGFGLSEGTGAYLHNTLAWATAEGVTSGANSDWATLLFRNMLKNQQFRNKFITRFADLLNTGFLPKRVESLITTMSSRIAPDIEEHFARWGYPNYYNEWSQSVESMVFFGNNRPKEQRQHILEHFELDGFIGVTLDVSNQLMGHIRINTVEITPRTPGVDNHPYPWNGIYFKGIPVELEAIAAPGYRFSHWEGASSSASHVLQFPGSNDIGITAHFEKESDHSLMYFWLFTSQIPNNTPLVSVQPTYTINPLGQLEYASSLPNYPFYESHSSWRVASLERVNSPTPINYMPKGNGNISYPDVDMRGIQVKQPFNLNGRDSHLMLRMPTVGFSSIKLRFAARDEGFGNYISLEYSVDKGNKEWTSAGLRQSSIYLKREYQSYEIDFGSIPEISNNPHFMVRLLFNGMYMDNYQNRVIINNISLEGVSFEAYNLYLTAGNHGDILPSGVVPIFHGDSMRITIVPEAGYQIHDITLNGVSQMQGLRITNRDTTTYELEPVFADKSIHVDFVDIFSQRDEDVIIYPNPAQGRVTVTAQHPIRRVEAVNLLGGMIKSENTYTYIHSMDISSLTSGLYVIVVKTEQGVYSRKLVVKQ